ncbi:MAG TPA: SIS domain-containing protein [Egibacteraceae bacterium]|nr:SIS domain-containing protein [Egibacteraceae bacterium]
MDLDDVDRYAAVDRSDALGDVERTAEQWESALRTAPAPVDLVGVDAVVCTGMGGSGIAGGVVRAVAGETFALPVVVHRGYGVPAFVGSSTLVVAFSHSGNTEETRSAFDEAGRRGARRLLVTSGGALAAAATDRDTVVRYDPQGRPPRHSLPSLAVPALAALGLTDGLDEAVTVLRALAGDHGRHVPTADNPTKALAARLAGGAVAMCWGGEGIGAVMAYRLKCQLNENAKLPAGVAVLPEADHNDVVGWEQPSKLSGVAAVVAVRDRAGEHEQVSRRFTITLDIVRSQLAFAAELSAVGTTPVARAASLLLQCDLLSVYTALALDRDPSPVASIDRLKADLAGVVAG